MKESFPKETRQISSVNYVHSESRLSGQITECSCSNDIHSQFQKLIQTAGQPMQRVSCKLSAMGKLAVLLESGMLTSYHPDQIVKVIQYYSFATNVGRMFQVFCLDEFASNHLCILGNCFVYLPCNMHAIYSPVICFSL